MPTQILVPCWRIRIWTCLMYLQAKPPLLLLRLSTGPVMLRVRCGAWSLYAEHAARPTFCTSTVWEEPSRECSKEGAMALMMLQTQGVHALTDNDFDAAISCSSNGLVAYCCRLLKRRMTQS